MSTKLPIDVVPGRQPLQFFWTDMIDDMSGARRIIKQEGSLPAGVDNKVASLIALAKRLEKQNDAVMAENLNLREQLDGLLAEKQRATQPTAAPQGSSVKKR